MRNSRILMKDYVVPFMIASSLTVTTYWLAKNNFGIFHAVQYDDSYVTYRYSWNLANGNGMRFNPLDLTNSASSFSFTFLLAMIGSFFSLTAIPKISLAVSLLSFNLMLFLLWKFWMKDRTTLAGTSMFALTALLICSSPYFQYWLISGMETIFFISLLVGVMLVPSLTQSKEKSVVLDFSILALFICLTITRVEGFLMALSVSFIWFLHQRKNKTKLTMTSQPVYAALGSISAFFLLTLFNWIYYGQIVGDPVRFKPIVRYYSTTYAEALANTTSFLWDHNFFISFLAALLVLIRIFQVLNQKVSISFEEILLGSTFFVYFAYLTRVPNSDVYRYQLPLLVICILLLAKMIERAHFDFVKNNGVIGFRQLLTFITIVFLGVSVNLNIAETRAVYSGVSNYLYVQEARIAAGNWLESNTPPGSKVLAGDIGAISFFNPSNEYVDSAGLVNRKLLDTVISSGDYSEAIRSSRPDYVADTAGADNVTASEGIYDDPQSYYEPSKTSVFSNCNIANSSFQNSLVRFPSEEVGVLHIKIAEMDWFECDLP